MRDISLKSGKKLHLTQIHYDINYYKEYIGSVDIYALNEKDERTFGVRLEEAYPDTRLVVSFSHEKVSSVNTFLSGFQV